MLASEAAGALLRICDGTEDHKSRFRACLGRRSDDEPSLWINVSDNFGEDEALLEAHITL